MVEGQSVRRSRWTRKNGKEFVQFVLERTPTPIGSGNTRGERLRTLWNEGVI